jgi:endonuclease/exonuclease/phosphatase family metal-dependent hydrolase
MRLNLWTRRRLVLGQEVREPTLLALAVTVLGLLLLLAVCAVAVAALPVLGYLWWVFAAVALTLAGLVRGLRRKPEPAAVPPTGRQRWSRRVRRLARQLFVGVLACWLGLIAWAELSPGSPAPLKADPALIRVVTWNIHCGQDAGLPWQRFDWPARKHSLRAALDQARPDILCVQEARPGQVRFLEQALPGHRRVGVGRDDGAEGEHCAIYFDRERFEESAGGTFWLEEPTDRPGPSAALDVKRICTWVRLRDRRTGRTLRVYNAHLYLTEAPRRPAARIILAHVAAGDPADAVVLSADFNASPAAPSRRLFAEAGLADSAGRAGKPAGRPTFHLYGIGLWCIDGILVDSHFGVRDHRVWNAKPRNPFPSDHFAVLADLALPG